MNIIRFIRKRFSLKLFLSYLVIILVGVIVLFSAADLVIPTAFNRHMGAMMGDGMGMMGTSMGDDLFLNFRDAMIEALLWAAGASIASALVVSAFVSRQVVAPIQAMTRASLHIADGHYRERVPSDNSGEGDELSQLAHSFNRMAERLEQTEEMRRRLIGDVAHELRTPLTTIKGSMEGLLDGVLPASEDTFLSIHREADRLQRLVSDLQEISRVESGELQLRPTELDVRDWMMSIVQRLKPQFDQKQVALQVEFPSTKVQVQADADRLTQVLINLLGNALQYTPAGGEVDLSAALESVRSVKGQHQLRITVKDTGIGIPADHLPHIFDRFYRVDKSRSRAGGGSGVGLTIAKHWVEAHGGSIHVESEGAGKGATFTIRIPQNPLRYL